MCIRDSLYIDRIVVDGDRRARGSGRRLYQDLMAFAREQDITDIVCEYNSVPPNEISKAFHASLGFVEMGEAWLSDSKCVSYQRLALGQE